MTKQNPVGRAHDDGRVTWYDPIPEGGAYIYAAPVTALDHFAADVEAALNNEAQTGMAWYNNCSEAERAKWHAAAGSAVPADAYRAFCEQPAQAQEAEPALPLALKTHGAWDGLEGLDDLPDGTEIYAGRPPRSQADAPAAPAPAPLSAVLEQIARNWDGCMYDAPGETIDIGADIRAAAARLLAEQPAAVAPQGEYPQLPKAAVWSVSGKDEMPTFGKGWMFSPVQQCNATLPLFTARQMWAYHDLGRQAAPALEAPAYVDRTPELHVGDSAFERWYADYNPAEKSDKQRARDAYAAGMGDPLVMAAPAAKPGDLVAVPRRYTVGDLSRALEAPVGWREQFSAAVYDDLAAADNQDVPLEQYPARILKVLDTVVGPRHPAVVQWRNDAIQACITVAFKYCRDPESFQYLKQDLQALMTAVPALAAAPQAPAHEAPAAPIQHQGMTITGNGAAELGKLMREQRDSRLGVYPDGNPNSGQP